MTLSELKTTLLSRLSAGSDSSYYDSTSLVDIIKGGQIQLANFKPWSCLMIGAKRAGGTVKDQNNYGIPDDYSLGNSIWIEIDDKDYDYVSFPTFRDDTFTFDKKFTIVGNEIFIVPAPTSNGKVIQYWYIKTPKVLSVDNDVSDFPDIFKETLLNFAISIAKGREGDENSSLKYLKIAQMQANDIWKISQRIVKGAKKVMDITEWGVQ